ncbi:unnamed protein product [Jaminaea pallidilutea]
MTRRWWSVEKEVRQRSTRGHQQLFLLLSGDPRRRFVFLHRLSRIETYFEDTDYSSPLLLKPPTMHPHLVQGKAERCGDLIAALEECHSKGLMHRTLGMCNGIKHDLNMCLRAERIERTAKHVEESKARAADKKKLFAKIDEES